MRPRHKQLRATFSAAIGESFSMRKGIQMHGFKRDIRCDRTLFVRLFTILCVFSTVIFFPVSVAGKAESSNPSAEKHSALPTGVLLNSTAVPLADVRVVVTPLIDDQLYTPEADMLTTNSNGEFTPITRVTTDGKDIHQWAVSLDSLAWELPQKTLLDKNFRRFVASPLPLNAEYQSRQSRLTPNVSARIRVRLVDESGNPVPQLRTKIRLLSDPNAAVLGDAYTSAAGEMTAVIPAASVGRSEALYTITIDSNAWYAIQPKLQNTTDEQIVSVARIPVIFVPGIMGSYLDYKDPDLPDNGTCSLWLEAGDNCSFGWEYAKQAKVRNLLFDLTNPLIYPTDITRDQHKLSAVYTKIMDTLSAEWPEYRDIDFKKPAFERCEFIKDRVLSGRIPRNQTLLYAFGYDWRQTTRSNGEKLSRFVDCVRSTHQNSKVNLVGHSMGGLVIKQMLLHEKTSEHIASVTTFNTPYLGAVRAIQILGDGKYDSVSRIVLAAVHLKEIARIIPGALELLPSNLYLNRNVGGSAKGSVLTIDGKSQTSVATHWNSLKMLFGPSTDLYKLEDDVGRDDLNQIISRTAGIDYLILTSSMNNSTPNRVNVTGSEPSKKYQLDYGPGDTTVNEFSANRVSKRLDWNPKTIQGSRRVITMGFCFPFYDFTGFAKLDHTGLVSHYGAIQTYRSFLLDPTGLEANNYFTRCENGKETLNLGYPSPTEPANGFVTTEGIWPTLQWIPGNGVDKAPFGYRIQVSTDAQFRTLIVDECRSEATYPPPDIAFGKKYLRKLFWRVNYVPNAWWFQTTCKLRHTPNPDTWSDVRSFTNSIASGGGGSAVIRPSTICNGCSLGMVEDASSPNEVLLGFSVNYFDGITNSVFVNNNGSVSFYEPVSNFRSTTLSDNSNPMLAGFFADVDTRASGSGTVTYGRSTISGRKAFIVNYFDVGYSERHAEKRNKFQIVLIDRSDVSPGDFDVEYNYATIVWETGDRNGGTAGRGGNSVRVGYSSGQGDANWYEFPGSGVPGSFLDSNPTTGLIHTSAGSGGIKGRRIIQFRNGRAIIPSVP
jgi:pimeloyl-ACP methyl ester carboxylesterase